MPVFERNPSLSRTYSTDHTDGIGLGAKSAKEKRKKSRFFFLNFSIGGFDHKSPATFRLNRPRCKFIENPKKESKLPKGKRYKDQCTCVSSRHRPKF